MAQQNISKIKEITMIEKVLAILLLLFVLFYLFTGDLNILTHLQVGAYLTVIGRLSLIVIPLLLTMLIFLRFSNENKAIISIIFGILGLSFLIINLFDRYTPLNIWFGLSIQISSIFGLIYGIIGLKSEKKNLAIVGIIFNTLQFVTLLIPKYVM